MAALPLLTKAMVHSNWATMWRDYHAAYSWKRWWTSVEVLMILLACIVGYCNLTRPVDDDEALTEAILMVT
jgi:hypothetical protein